MPNEDSTRYTPRTYPTFEVSVEKSDMQADDVDVFDITITWLDGCGGSKVIRANCVELSAPVPRQVSGTVYDSLSGDPTPPTPDEAPQDSRPTGLDLLHYLFEGHRSVALLGDAVDADARAEALAGMLDIAERIARIEAGLPGVQRECTPATAGQDANRAELTDARCLYCSSADVRVDGATAWTCNVCGTRTWLDFAKGKWAGVPQPAEGMGQWRCSCGSVIEGPADIQPGAYLACTCGQRWEGAGFGGIRKVQEVQP